MNKICRICLEDGVFTSIFAKNYDLTLSDMIEYCCNTKIIRADGLPEQLCSNCAYKLGIAYHFKQTYESSDTRLRQYLGVHKHVKTYNVAVMTDPVPVSITQTIIKSCKCKQLAKHKKSSTNYKKKPELDKLKRGPKPKPKPTHSCYECGKEFRCQTQLETHIRTHTGAKPFVCKYCPRSFSQKHNLVIHVRTHTGEKPFQCEVCSKRFSAQGNLQAHIKIHTGQKDHARTICSKEFITSGELTRHMNKHRGVKNFKCDLCEASYVNNRDLKSHKQKKHQVLLESIKEHTEGYNNSNIDVTGIGIDVKEAKNIESTKARPNEPSCPMQDATKTFIFKKEEKKDVYTSGTHVCNICGEGFSYLSMLAHHLQSHKDFNTNTT